MATYAIGDLQGCYSDLQRLLEKLQFNPQQDRLWFAGDLVNRGPESLQCLRFVKSLGDRAITVLGNHDLHLLAVAAGMKEAKDDGLDKITAAHDSAELLDWLRRQPLLHHDRQHSLVMVHAGIYPFWNLPQAQSCAKELEAVLSGDHYHDFLHVMYGNEPARWEDGLQDWDRLRFICNSFTRMRFCNTDGRLDLVDKGKPGSQIQNYMPWYAVPGRKTAHIPVLFGHWSTLGDPAVNNIYPLDHGCVWGGQLTALRIDIQPMQYISLDCPGAKKPGED
ncbi:MAG: symmetrical bis(5'-nucleosyl)-tetraphosphatase [Gammaproteobacteria bacterium]|nr:symmetrical bis(5'-nucleosyl)-tetraphosphatase [Gammaproteobacteria bacterium]MDH5652462.1 symmetrical bis(5'-nucleosyl)-tetraphosphatase [Gammaproteobacteria bacterium]